LGWLEVECNRCKTRASLPLDAIRRPWDTPIWKLEAALKCRSCRKGRYAPPVRMIKLTETREITPYQWMHPNEERGPPGSRALAGRRGCIRTRPAGSRRRAFIISCSQTPARNRCPRAGLGKIDLTG
jgi:hypothetical protein